MTRTSILRVVFASAVALCSILAVQSSAQPAASGVTLTGLITCSRCVGIETQHKGYTPWSWALHSVNQGDDIVFVTPGKTYKLQGDKQQLLKYIADEATVTGQLDSSTIAVSNITRPTSK